MDWSDEGIIISTRRHGEASVIVELMTARHGRHLGLVRGGRSRAQRPVLLAGNSVQATWRARLDEHLGTYALEPSAFRAARLMETPAGLYGLQALAALVRLLPERDPHPQIFVALSTLVDLFEDPVLAAGLLVRFELRILDELGFGLDLERCVATGTNDDLAYVSPKSGRAVCRSAGDPYRDRMLRLPGFLADAPGGRPGADELIDAFRLSGFFLSRHVYEPRGLPQPEARDRFVALFSPERRKDRADAVETGA